MSWRALITAIYENRRHSPGIAGRPEFFPGAAPQAVADAEAALSAALPDSLRALLLETNGVMDMLAVDGGDWFESMWLLWKIEEIVAQNRLYRAASPDGMYRRDFSNLVFFAGAGTDGILFGLPVENGACASRVMVWHPLRDKLDTVAPSLADFLQGWLTSTISV